MHVFLTISLLSSLCFSSLSQNNTKATDVYVASVDKLLKENALVKKSPGEKSSVGGALTGHYLKNRLKLITSHDGDHFSYITYSFYISNDSLVFVNERKVSLKEPVTEKEYAEYEKYMIFNTDKNGNTDYSKWPLTVDINNTYYIASRKITRCELKNFGKPVKLATDTTVEGISKELIRRYTIHMEELR